MSYLCRSLLLLCLLLWLSGCSGGEERKDKGAARPPLPVTVARATEASVPLQLALFGTVESKASVPVKARVSGQLLQVHFREGDDVAKGALLFSIDPRPFELALQQAEAAFARDRAQQSQARQQLERYNQLLAQGFVSQQEFEQVQSGSVALDAVLASDQAAIAAARLQLDYCSIRAPFSGRTGSLLADPGLLIKADDAPLVVIQQLRPISVSFTAPEKSFDAIRQAMARGRLQVATVAEAATGPVERGQLDFVDNAVDPATGTIRLKATFANASGRLWPGAFARVELALGALEKAVTVPAAAVQSGQQGEFLFVVKADGSVEQRPIRTGPTSAGWVVVSSGVAVGETVVTDGQMRLFPGAKVQAIDTAPKAAPGAAG